jgi:hypothetical protein
MSLEVLSNCEGLIQVHFTLSYWLDGLFSLLSNVPMTILFGI